MLIERGYDATSYQAIATETGKSRSMIQYYFPKKEQFAVSFLHRVLDLEVEFALTNLDVNKKDFAVFQYVLAQMQFYFLTNSPQMRALTAEMFSSRMITTAILDLDVDWTSRYVREVQTESIDFESPVVMSIGGAYEVIYYRLMREQEVSAAELAYISVLNVYSAFPEESRGLSERLADHELSQDLLERSEQYLFEGLLG